MKHITVDLENKIHASMTDAKARAHEMHQYRIRAADNHGEDLPDPMSPEEAKTVGWHRALKWVLEEAGCK